MFLKLAGIGLATAVFVDATVVRMVLVPRRWSCWATATGGCPAGSTGCCPTLDVEGDAAARAGPEPAATAGSWADADRESVPVP